MTEWRWCPVMVFCWDVGPVVCQYLLTSLGEWQIDRDAGACWIERLMKECIKYWF